MGVMEGINPQNIEESGWGIIFAEVDRERVPAIREALSELLNMRRAQSGALYREFTGPDGYRSGESKTGFLARHGCNPGPVRPDKMPYYLLLVGDPESIPYRFQYQLDVQHAVGRVYFDDLDAYAHYAHGVVKSETNPRIQGQLATFFSPEIFDDQPTRLIAQSLTVPLVERLQADIGLQSWQMNLVNGRDASKEHLLHLLEEEVPRFLLTTGHSLVYPSGHPLQRSRQGGLVCQDWPGPINWHEPIPPEFCFLAEDLSPKLNLFGAINFLYSSFSVGTDHYDELFMRFRRKVENAPRAFIAPLAQRLLANGRGRGALAVVGFSNRVWDFSFPSNYLVDLSFILSSIRSLLDGKPIGYAFEAFDERFAELASILSVELEDIEFGKELNAEELATKWVALNDMRNFSIFGDPAVRLKVGEIQPRTRETEFTRIASPAQIRGAALELEIGFYSGTLGNYIAEMRLRDLDSSDIGLQVHGAVTIDFDRLRTLEHDALNYGRVLTESLMSFAPQGDYFIQAIALSKHRVMRLILGIDRGVLELNNLRWETLRNPIDNSALLQSEDLYFSRYITGASLFRVERRPEGKLRALVLAASPSNLFEYNLSPVDVEVELMRELNTLGDIPVTKLPDSATGQRASLSGLFTILTKDPVDILTLICHAVLPRSMSEPALFLENEEGQLERVSGSELGRGLMELRIPPRLVVLRDGEEKALFALSSLLSVAGIPAVIALPNISLATSDLFLEAFYIELVKHGQVDRAAATARYAIRNEPDWWAPILSQRIRSGKIWN